MATLSGKKPKTSTNQPITFSSQTYTDKYKTATAFCQQFSNTVAHTTDRAARVSKRKVMMDHPLYHHTQGFYTSMVMQTINACSNLIATDSNCHTMLYLYPHPSLHSVPKVCWHTYNMEAGHHHSDSQGRQATPPWLLPAPHLPPLPWSKRPRVPFTPTTLPSPPAGTFPTRLKMKMKVC